MMLFRYGKVGMCCVMAVMVLLMIMAALKVSMLGFCVR